MNTDPTEITRILQMSELSRKLGAQEKQYRRSSIISGLLVTSISGLAAILALIFSNNLDTKTSRPDISKIESQQVVLQNNYDQLKAQLDKMKLNPNGVGVESKIFELQQQQAALNDAVTAEPGKLVTFALLKQKQESIDASISDLKKSQNDLSSKVDTLLLTLLAAPILSVLGSYLVIKFGPKQPQPNQKS